MSSELDGQTLLKVVPQMAADDTVVTEDLSVFLLSALGTDHNKYVATVRVGEAYVEFYGVAKTEHQFREALAAKVIQSVSKMNKDAILLACRAALEKNGGANTES